MWVEWGDDLQKRWLPIFSQSEFGSIYSLTEAHGDWLDFHPSISYCTWSRSILLVYFGFSEVQKAVQTARGLYQRWCELLEDPITVSKEEYDWTTNELRNSLRSIEWDLEDLEETINILLNNCPCACVVLERDRGDPDIPPKAWRYYDYSLRLQNSRGLHFFLDFFCIYVD